MVAVATPWSARPGQHAWPWTTEAGPDRVRPVPYGRRRAVAVVLLGAVVLVTWLGARAAVAALETSPSSTTAPAVIAAPEAPARIYVVQPGDTLWSIVTRRGGHGDPRPVIDRVEAAIGGRPLQVGERLVLP